MGFEYSDNIKNIFLLILSLKKKIIIFFLLLLIGSIIAYPIVGFIVKDITSRDIPYASNINNVEYINGKYIFQIRDVHFQIITNKLEINQKIILEYISINIIKNDSFFIIDSKINSYYITHKSTIDRLQKIFLLNKNNSDLNFKNKIISNNNFVIYIYKNINTINESNLKQDFYLKKKDSNQMILIINNHINININSQHEINPTIIYTKPLEITILNMKYSFILGFIFSLPYLFYIIIKKIESLFSIKLNIKSKLFSYIIIILLTFIIGFLIGYFICSPLFINFLYFNASYSGIQASYTISHFVSFIFLISLLFGFLFEFPIILLLLNKINLVKLETFEEYRKHLYVLFFIFSGIITPPDVFTQLIVAIPMIIFYEISILIMKIYRYY